MTNSSIDLSKNCDQLTIDCLTDLSYEAKELNVEIENFEFELSGARMLGRDMAKIMSPKTKGMVLDILALHTDPDKNDSLIAAIIMYLPDKNYERGLKLLQNLKTGILDN
jgi:predicted nucleotidyltransferase